MCRVRRARQCVLSRVCRPDAGVCARRECAERESGGNPIFNLNTVIGKVRKKVSNQVLWTVHTGFPYLYYTYIRLLYI